VSVTELASDPHQVLARLRESEPVSWVPALGGWLVTRFDLATRVLRDWRLFTVDDPRFTTARVVGPSMLSLDGPAHRRHRDPFARMLRTDDRRAGLAEVAQREAARLVAELARAGSGRAELRRGLAGPLAVAVMAQMLGLSAGAAQLLAWYDAIVAAVSALSADPGGDVPGEAVRAYGELSEHVVAALTAGGEVSVLTGAAGRLETREIVSNAAVLLFGGIETTEGLISNALWHLLGDPAALAAVLAQPILTGAAVEESLRLEPAAAVVDRYAVADVFLGPAAIRRSDLVIVSLAGANRDPAVFAEPDRLDLHRAHPRQHLAFALGPHFCVGADLARIEATAALHALLSALPGVRLDPRRPGAPAGLVFRKPPALNVSW
jgi:cytochrome P450